jgi:hypothetical protein
MKFWDMKKQLSDWVGELGTFRTQPNAWRFEDLHPEADTETGRLIFCTATNQYTIRFVSHERTYLGCGASSRITRPGETWARGNDLADGPFNRETWDRILRDILAYELVALDPLPEPQETPSEAVPA